MMSLYDPFLPKVLEMTYEKGIKYKEETELIGEDIQGLLDYFSCPTVRHKVNLIVSFILINLIHF